jgi:hypothetical protein
MASMRPPEKDTKENQHFKFFYYLKRQEILLYGRSKAQINALS